MVLNIKMQIGMNVDEFKTNWMFLIFIESTAKVI